MRAWWPWGECIAWTDETCYRKSKQCDVVVAKHHHIMVARAVPAKNETNWTSCSSRRMLTNASLVRSRIVRTPPPRRRRSSRQQQRRAQRAEELAPWRLSHAQVKHLAAGWLSTFQSAHAARILCHLPALSAVHPPLHQLSPTLFSNPRKVIHLSRHSSCYDRAIRIFVVDLF